MEKKSQFYTWTSYAVVFGSVMDRPLLCRSCSHSSFFSSFFPFCMELPYPSSDLAVDSFSLSTVYTLCVLWLVISKSLCVRFYVFFIQHWYCPKDPLPLSSDTRFWQSFSFSSLRDGPRPESCSWSYLRLGLLLGRPGTCQLSQADRQEEWQRRKVGCSGHETQINLVPELSVPQNCKESPATPKDCRKK